MSVPPTSKGVVESEDAADETARGQELEAGTVGGTTAGERFLTDMEFKKNAAAWGDKYMAPLPKQPYFGDVSQLAEKV